MSSVVNMEVQLLRLNRTRLNGTFLQQTQTTKANTCTDCTRSTSTYGHRTTQACSWTRCDEYCSHISFKSSRIQKLYRRHRNITSTRMIQWALLLPTWKEPRYHTRVALLASAQRKRFLGLHKQLSLALLPVYLPQVLRQQRQAMHLWPPITLLHLLHQSP